MEAVKLCADKSSTGMNLSRNSDVSSDLMLSLLLLGCTAHRLLLVLVSVVRRGMLELRPVSIDFINIDLNSMFDSAL